MLLNIKDTKLHAQAAVMSSSATTHRSTAKVDASQDKHKHRDLQCLLLCCDVLLEPEEVDAGRQRWHQREHHHHKDIGHLEAHSGQRFFCAAALLYCVGTRALADAGLMSGSGCTVHAQQGEDSNFFLQVAMEACQQTQRLKDHPKHQKNGSHFVWISNLQAYQVLHVSVHTGCGYVHRCQCATTTVPYAPVQESNAKHVAEAPICEVW